MTSPSQNLKIDLHTHILPANLPRFAQRLKDNGPYTYLDYFTDQTCCPPKKKARMLKEGEEGIFRVIDENCWNENLRLNECDEAGVKIQVLSTVPVMFNYWAKPRHALEVCQFLNDHLASIHQKYPHRFLGFGTLPMQDPELAIEEAMRSIKELKLSGFQIGTSVNGDNLSDRKFFPLYKALEELKAPLFVHPWDMVMNNAVTPSYWLPWLVGMPAETSRAICSMIFADIFSQFPKLKVCFAHGGGSFPGTLGRIQHGYHCRPDLCAVDSPEHSPQWNIGKFYVDSLVHDEKTLRFLLDTIGSDFVMLGSDYPFPLGELVPGQMLTNSQLFSQAEKNKILFQTAQNFLKLS
jgi:aminocarboxymuconate-semialdehyde decarboxylase